MIQKDQLFMRGMRHVRRADLQRHHPVGQATKAGITPPKIMTSACTVVIWLKNSGFTNCRPGWASARHG